MVSVSQMKVRIEEVLRNHKEVISFAVDGWLPGSGTKRWFFFLDHYLPLLFRVSARKGRNSRFVFWIESFDFANLSGEYDVKTTTARELTASRFLSKELEADINELIQEIKQQIQSYSTLFVQQKNELPTYRELFDHAMNQSVDKNTQQVIRLLAWGGIYDDSGQFKLLQ